VDGDDAAAMSAIIIGTVNGLIRFGPRSISCVWLFSISSMPRCLS